MIYHAKDEAFYRKLDVAPPSVAEHGTEDDIRANLKQLLPNSWVLEGNQLKGQTEMGLLVQTIPTNVILIGTDKKGIPMFKTIEL